MLKGRFLGIAQNIGDAFCFFIFTHPEDVDTTSPQVLARSIIRRRYAMDEAPVVETNNSAPASLLLIYKSDGITLLDDWIPSCTDDDHLNNIVADDNLSRAVLSDGGGGHSSSIPIGMSEETACESSLVKVYGPTTKRP